MAESLEADGFAELRDRVAGRDLESLRQAVGKLQAMSGKPCVRDLLQRSMVVAEFAWRQVVEKESPLGEMVPVRAIIFDKTPEVNWPVAWHQDLTIAVAAKAELPGYTAWTVKDGVPHVQPPIDLLEKMVTLRLHLDAASAANGALRIAPATHRHGRISGTSIAAALRQAGERSCPASAGDAHLMKPLILHASGRATSPSHRHRRVLHIEYAPPDGLNPALQWHDGR